MFLAKKLNRGAGTPAAPADAQFNYVTMLLHGDGTNGAQNNTFLDSGPNTLTITRNGNTTQGSFSPYGSNWSNYFDGSGDYLTVPDNAVFSLGSGNFTIEAWVNPTASPNQPMIIGQWTSSYAWTMQLSNDGNRNLRALLHDGSFQDYVSTSPLGLNTWNHCAFVRESNTVSLYLNGSRVFTTTFSGTVTNSTSAVSVGADASGGQPLQGYISNARVVVGTALYSGATYTVPTTPLTAISGTSLLTCQSNRFFDSSSTASAVTAFGNTSVQRFNPFGTSTAYSTSVIGGSGYFDGTGDYLSIATNSALQFGTGDFTFECWIYPNGVAGNEFIADFGASSASGWGLYDEGSGGNMQFRIADTDRIAVNPLVARAWSHVAVVRSGTTATLYVNGTSVGSYGSAGTNLTYSGTNYIGSQSGSSNYMNGYMSNVRAVKGTAVYTANFTPSTSPLTAISGTSLLLSTTNGAIFDNAMMNDLETVGNAQISTSVKKYGTGSLAFDGTGDYLQAPDSPVFNLGSGNWTIESWIYINSAKNYNGFYGKRQAGQFGLALQIDSSGVLSISASITGSSWALGGASLGSGYTTGAWMHVAVTRSGTTITGWLNGTSTGTQTLSGSIFPSTGYPATIGSANDSGQELNGYMDDFRLTNGFCRYTTTFTPPTSALSDTGPY